MIEATHNVHQGALAGTADPHQRHELRPGDLLGNPSEHRQIKFTQVVSLADVVEFDEFHIRHTVAEFSGGRREVVDAARRESAQIGV